MDSSAHGNDSNSHMHLNEMSTHDRTKQSGRAYLVGVLLIGVGVLIGLVLTANLDWTPFGHAVPDPEPDGARVTLTAPTGVSLPAGRTQDFVPVAKAVMPAVVNIFSRRSGGSASFHGFSDDPSLRRFFGDEFMKRFEDPGERQIPRDRGLGSGVIVDPSGVIVTNHHVVGQADEIKVLLADRSEFKARLVGTDPKSDLAVLKIEAQGLPTIPWADSDQLEVGEYVLAVGNPFGLNQTVTMGIVSAVGRARMGIAEYEDFIQTDAAINPGNSGGPLVNARGEVVGINTAIFSRSGGSMGIGFAVPSNMARIVLEQLVATGRVVRGWLGVSIQDVTRELAEQAGVAEPKGVLVSDILDDSPAERAGIRRGDVIVEFEGKEVENATQLRNLVAVTEVGKQVSLTVLRNGQEQRIPVLIGEQPTRVAQASR